ncbi:MAG: hypothetical protein QXT31_06660 [Candidatus Bathyarchaeia archaeon]
MARRREDLLNADFVSLKVDAVSQDLWKCINRPYKGLRLDMILDGIKLFTKTFVIETMLIDNINYNNEFEKIAI